MPYSADVLLCNRQHHQLRVGNVLRSFGANEQGGEVLESALIARLMVVAALSAIGKVGVKLWLNGPPLTAACKGLQSDLIGSVEIDTITAALGRRDTLLAI